MKTLTTLAALLSVVSAKSSQSSPLHPPQHIVSNPPVNDEWYKIPSVRESTAMARKIMHLTTLGDLVTVFPEAYQSNDAETLETRPPEVAGNPIGLVEYYADCEPHSGNPILLGINIATPYKNYNEGSNISLGIRWWPKQETAYSLWADEEDIPTPHTPAALPRFSLHGHLEPLSKEQLADGKIAACFLRAHPDSVLWQPGNDIHTSRYTQLIVDHVYWFGGFGDRARIGWLPVEVWRNLTMEEIMDAKLPGERQAKSWFRNWL